MFQVAMGGKIRDTNFAFSALEASLASTTFGSVAKHGHAVHRHGNVGIDVRIRAGHRAVERPFHGSGAIGRHLIRRL